MMWRALMVPREVWRACLAFAYVVRSDDEEGEMLVTGVSVCRFSFLSRMSFSRMKAMYLYGHREPAFAVSVAAGASLTRSF